MAKKTDLRSGRLVDVLHDLLHRCDHFARLEVVRLGRIHMRTERLSCDVEYIFWT